MAKAVKVGGKGEERSPERARGGGSREEDEEEAKGGGDVMGTPMRRVRVSARSLREVPSPVR